MRVADSWAPEWLLELLLQAASAHVGGSISPAFTASIHSHVTEGLATQPITRRPHGRETAFCFGPGRMTDDLAVWFPYWCHLTGRWASIWAAHDLIALDDESLAYTALTPPRLSFDFDGRCAEASGRQRLDSSVGFKIMAVTTLSRRHGPW